MTDLECWVRDSLVLEERNLVESIQLLLGKKVVDVELLANLLSEKNSNSTGRIQASHVSDCLKKVGIDLDKTLLGKITKFTEVKRGSCSISQLVELVKAASNPMNEEGGQKGSCEIRRCHVLIYFDSLLARCRLCQ